MSRQKNNYIICYLHQQQNYKQNQDIIKDETIKKLWIEFIDKYKEYF